MPKEVVTFPDTRPSGLADSDIEFLLIQSERALDAQWESADRLAGRASTMIGVGVSILTGVLVVAATSSSSTIPKWIFVPAAIFLLGSAIAASFAYFVRDANYPPDPVPMVNDVAKSPGDYRWKLLTTVARAHKEDAVLTFNRSRLVNVSLGLFMVSISIINVGVAVYLW